METKRIEEVKMIIRFFNLQAGTSLSTSAETSTELVSRCLEVKDVHEIKNHIKEWLANNEKKSFSSTSAKFTECMTSLIYESKVSTPAPASAPVSDNQVGGALGIEGAKVKISKRKIQARAIWYHKMKAKVVPYDELPEYMLDDSDIKVKDDEEK